MHLPKSDGHVLDHLGPSGTTLKVILASELPVVLIKVAVGSSLQPDFPSAQSSFLQLPSTGVDPKGTLNKHPAH